MNKSLTYFHPVIQAWFKKTYGQPTDIQEQSWPVIAKGGHVLITAPTGSGKTLTAFLWAINQLITNQWPTGYTRVLYISPLKALNNDIQRNLIKPLYALKQYFEMQGKTFPDIRVLTRSGDTPQSERRQMVRKPPEILITTPESLNLLLSSKSGRTILTGLQSVILDEIHGIVGSKRGTHLITGVDRLVPLSGEFQRMGLSATIHPLETIAAFLGGFQINGPPEAPDYQSRSVSIIKSQDVKQLDVQIRYPHDKGDFSTSEAFWKPIIEELKTIIGQNKSTLLFTNSRRLCEKMTLKINRTEETPIAYAHHGSLSKEIRHHVEQRLKNGELKAIVATSSLEMGIDIGSLDEVVLIQSPMSISSAIQKIGRAGHQVGETSKGTFFPTFDHDFLEAAVLVKAIQDRDIEPITPIENALDVLSQILIYMIGFENSDINWLYNQIKCSYPYRHLSQEQFNLVLNMLAGKYSDTRIQELRARITIDKVDNTVALTKGALYDLYFSGGTIPDRGYFHLRHASNNARIGELDEEFVWEAKIGDTFTLGTQHWKIQRITHNDVFVIPAAKGTINTPFWRADARNRDGHFSDKIAHFLKIHNSIVGTEKFIQTLQIQYCMDEVSSNRLSDYLKKQKEETRCDLPHTYHVIVEHVNSGPEGLPGKQVIIHTLWGNPLNRPFSMALQAAWEEKYHERLEVFSGNDCIVLQLPHDLPANELFALIPAERIEHFLKQNLEGSGFFGAQFRECAGRALLLSGKRFNERMPLWMSRLKSQKILSTVQKFRDFPVLLETWRTCLNDYFDLDALKAKLAQIQSGEISISEINTSHPSPMARNLSYQQINQYMYESDELKTTQKTSLRSELIEALVYNADERPPIPREIIQTFQEKRHRLWPGYSPSASTDLVAWISERILLMQNEWIDLINIMKRDHEENHASIFDEAAPKIIQIQFDGKERQIAALENLESIIASSKNDPAKITNLNNESIQWGSNRSFDEDIRLKLLQTWMSYYGPISYEFIQNSFIIEEDVLSVLLEDLIDSKRIIQGQLIDKDEHNYFCDANNYEILLRMTRKTLPVFTPLDIEKLPLFLATVQGLTSPKQDEQVIDILDKLNCYSASASLWEKEIFPSRIQNYHLQASDAALQNHGILWIGFHNKSICFCHPEDMDLIVNSEPDNHSQVTNKNQLQTFIKDPAAKYEFSILLQHSKKSPVELYHSIWENVWDQKITSDTLIPLRKGIQTQFKLPDVISENRQNQIRSRRAGFRSRFNKWKGSLPYAGNWMLLHFPEITDDPIDEEERNKDRVRLLLDRYGILFRELCNRELATFSWRGIFRSLRLMELSGEILSGYFIKDLPGPQFISHQAFRLLQQKLPEDTIFWINATDPASCCGLGLTALKNKFPKRLDSTHLVFHGSEVKLILTGNGKQVRIHSEPASPHLLEYFQVFHHLLTRKFMPLPKMQIENINNIEASKSPFLDVFRQHFEVNVDYKKIVLYRKHT